MQVYILLNKSQLKRILMTELQTFGKKQFQLKQKLTVVALSPEIEPVNFWFWGGSDELSGRRCS